MLIKDIQDKIIEEFKQLHNWFEKYERLIAFGKSLKPMNSEFKTDENLISGCQSKVWLSAEKKDGKIYFNADSDTLITKGIISLLLKVVNEQTPKEIVDCDLYFVKRIGLSTNLSPARANGLNSIIKEIKSRAENFI